MKKYMIMFLIGRDRPGIIDDVSRMLFEHGANIEDSHMASMGGHFSIMTLFSCRPEQTESIKTGLDKLEELGLKATLHHAEDPATLPPSTGLPLTIVVRAMDHPGIVQRVVRVLRHHKANITYLNTQTTRAPFSGDALFDITLEATIPADKPIAMIKEELSVLAGDINLDLSFKV
jgi:glycine cleavage system transcriptional repressor